MDLVSLAVTAAFYVPFAVSVRRYLERRDPLEWAVVLVFSSIAALFALTTLVAAVPSIAPVLEPAGLLLLMAQPVLMVRLVGLFRPLWDGALELAASGSLVALIWYYAGGRSSVSVLALVACFVLTESLAAVALLDDARRRQGFPRFRLGTAAVASVLFALAVAASAVSSTSGIAGLEPGARGDAFLVSRLLELVAAIGYVVAFVPPRWVRDLAHRAIAFDLVRSIVAAPTGTDQALLWREFASTVRDILGTTRIVVVGGGVPIVDLTRGEPAGRGSAESPDPPSRGMRVSVPLESEGRIVGELTAELDGRPLFLDDDVALIGLLGSLTARAVQREQAVGALTEAERAVSEAAALRASEARFRALLEAEPNAILSLGPDGRVRWATASAGRMFGRPEAELVGQPLAALVARPPTPGPAHVEGALRYEGVGSLPDGRTFPAEVATTEMELDGETVQLVVVTDIAWRAEANALRDQFIGVLSHELRTPVTAIYGGAQLLLRPRGLDADTRSALLEDVAAESDRLQRMIENLLVLARVERGAELAELGPILPHRLLASFVARERSMTPSITLVLSVPERLRLVVGDEASIALVLRNLISNAAKYAGPGGHVEVTAEDDADGGVLVRVLDDGPGIRPDEADHLFTLYYRSDATKEAPGSGIGLFVCRQLIEAMGGRIAARRRPEGGSEFAFSLRPYVEDAEEAQAAAAPEAGATPDPGEAPELGDAPEAGEARAVASGARR